VVELRVVRDLLRDLAAAAADDELQLPRVGRARQLEVEQRVAVGAGHGGGAQGRLLPAVEFEVGFEADAARGLTRGRVQGVGACAKARAVKGEARRGDVQLEEVGRDGGERDDAVGRGDAVRPRRDAVAEAEPRQLAPLCFGERVEAEGEDEGERAAPDADGLAALGARADDAARVNQFGGDVRREAAARRVVVGERDLDDLAARREAGRVFVNAEVRSGR